MSTQDSLFDAAGPKARRRIRIITALSLALMACIAVAVLLRFGQAGQLAPDRWVEFTQGPYLLFLLAGLGNTVAAAAVSAVFALPLGLVLALGRLSPRTSLQRFSTGWIEFFRSVPLLLVVYIFVSGLPQYGINPDIFWKLVIPITLCSSAVMAEIFRAGIRALPAGQSEAGLSLGLSQG
ncbi:ABC transporter permease subunit, partial [Arthrobacter sp. 2YAF22_2]|uniref:ABC transporter permease subunit n=1 Tax=Arthrobacter sp. 2YAF22_2 TaxID=3233029 RepID=UPI003F918F7C